MQDFKLMPSFEEWKKSQKCKLCNKGVSLHFKDYGVNTFKLRDVDGTKAKVFYCSECHEFAQAKLMNERFVEAYNGEIIWGKDGTYLPYWNSPYYFKSIEECRIRIDAKHIVVTPFGIADLKAILKNT